MQRAVVTLSEAGLALQVEDTRAMVGEPIINYQA